MADTVASQTILDGPKTAVMKFTNMQKTMVVVVYKLLTKIKKQLLLKQKKNSS